MKQPQGNANLVASFPVQLLTAGTSACIADLATFPLDTAKVRLQVRAGEGAEEDVEEGNFMSRSSFIT